MTAKEIAQWMFEKYSDHGRLVQHTAAYQIRTQFGEEWVYKNHNRNWAIIKPVLDEFKKLTPNAVWSRSKQLWRERRDSDKPGRMVK